MGEITLTLTGIEQSALMMILIEHARRADATQEWIDVVSEAKATTAELLTKVSPHITCPRCAMTSYSVGDQREEYCGNCHAYHCDLIAAWVYGILHAEPEPSGDFLHELARAAVRADPDNQARLRPALAAIMARYPKYVCTCGGKI
jgi:hypothetical protein